MFLRLALCIGIAAAVTVAGPHPSRAQQSQTPPPAPATKPDAATPAPAAPRTALPPAHPRPRQPPSRAIRSARTPRLTGKPMVYMQGHGHLGCRLRDDHQGLQERFEASPTRKTSKSTACR